VEHCSKLSSLYPSMLMPVDKVQAMKANRGSRNTASLILNLYVRWRLTAVLPLLLMSHESGMVI